jgi:hypothetical protein
MVVEQIVAGNKAARLEKLYAEITSRVREVRGATLGRDEA